MDRAGRRPADVVIPVRVKDAAGLAGVLDLIRDAFAYMEGLVDPPSSVAALDLTAATAHIDTGEVWRIGDPPVGAMFLTPKLGALYIGKLAVVAPRRGDGLARRLIDQAETRARALGLPVLELQTRVELTENHAVFTALGFTRTATTAHAGFSRPTSLTFTRRVGPPSRQAPGSG